MYFKLKICNKSNNKKYKAAQRLALSCVKFTDSSVKQTVTTGTHRGPNNWEKIVLFGNISSDILLCIQLVPPTSPNSACHTTTV